MIVGAIFILYYLVTKPNSENNDDHQLSKGYKFYLNVIIQNKSQVVKKRVSEKAPHGLFGIGRKIAANVADAVVDDEKFAKKIGNSLTKQIPNKLKEKFGSGITVKTENVFLKDNLVVISVEIAKANIVPDTFVKNQWSALRPMADQTVWPHTEKQRKRLYYRLLKVHHSELVSGSIDREFAV